MIQSFVLFSHIVGVLALFVGLGLEWISLDGVRRSATPAEALPWARLNAVVPRLSAVAVAAIVGSGFYLGARFGVLGNEWMRGSYGAMLLMAIIGGPVARAPMRALNRAAHDSEDRTGSALRAASSNPVLRLSLRVRILFGLAIVYLMIAKPDARGTLLVLALAAVATIAASVSRRTAQSTVLEGYR